MNSCGYIILLLLCTSPAHAATSKSKVSSKLRNENEEAAAVNVAKVEVEAAGRSKAEANVNKVMTKAAAEQKAVLLKAEAKAAEEQKAAVERAVAEQVAKADAATTAAAKAVRETAEVTAKKVEAKAAREHGESMKDMERIRNDTTPNASLLNNSESTAQLMFSAKPAPVLTLAGLVCFFILAGYVYVKRQWPVWFEQCALRAFSEVDRDRSGTIDKEEFYTCVIWLYLTLNEYGLKCCAPDRQTVTEIMSEGDSDESGSLEYPEFKQALDVLMAQTLGRFTTQLAFTMACPPLASAIVDGARKFVQLTPASLAVPLWLEDAGALVPDSVPALVLSTVLMVTLPAGLSYVDRLSKRALHERCRHAAKGTASRRQAWRGKKRLETEVAAPTQPTTSQATVAPDTSFGRHLPNTNQALGRLMLGAHVTLPLMLVFSVAAAVVEDSLTGPWPGVRGALELALLLAVLSSLLHEVDRQQKPSPASKDAVSPTCAATAPAVDDGPVPTCAATAPAVDDEPVQEPVAAEPAFALATEFAIEPVALDRPISDGAPITFVAPLADGGGGGSLGGSDGGSCSSSGLLHVVSAAGGGASLELVGRVACEPGSGGAATVLSVTLRCGAEHWQAAARYSAWRRLYVSLQETWPLVATRLSFPPKQLHILPPSPSFMAVRAAALERFLQDLLAEATQQPELRTWIEQVLVQRFVTARVWQGKNTARC